MTSYFHCVVEIRAAIYDQASPVAMAQNPFFYMPEPFSILGIKVAAAITLTIDRLKFNNCL